MSAAIGAALKKIAVALLTDKKVLKAIGMTVLVLIVALLLPLMAMMAILSGDIELDTDDGRYVYELDFTVGSMEYEYEIDANTGTVLNFKSEPID